MATYTPEQVYDALLRQGYSQDQAMAIAAAMGDQRRSDAELRRGYEAIGAKGARMPSGDDGSVDSNFIPNLGEGIGAALGYAAAMKKSPLLRFGSSGLGAILGGMGGQLASGTNYYERATDPQLAADIGGSIAGAVAGEKAGGAIATKGAQMAAKAAASKGIGKLAGTTLGRLLGAVGGPVGSLALGALGGALGGWGASKLIPGGSKSVEEEGPQQTRELNRNDDMGWAALGGLTAAALTPYAYRKWLRKAPIKSPDSAEFYTYPFDKAA